MNHQEHMKKFAALFDDFNNVPQFQKLSENNKVKMFTTWFERFVNRSQPKAPAPAAPVQQAPQPQGNRPQQNRGNRPSDSLTRKQVRAIESFLQDGWLTKDEVGDYFRLSRDDASKHISRGYDRLNAFQKQQKQAPPVQAPVQAPVAQTQPAPDEDDMPLFDKDEDEEAAAETDDRPFGGASSSGV